MAGVGPNDLFELAAELRDICIEALDTIPDAGVATDGFDMSDLEGSPSYAFVAPAAPIPDCCEVDGMLAVHVNNVTDRFARQADAGSEKVNVPNLIVSLLRCLPMGEGEGNDYSPPTDDEEELAARQTLADGWALWNGIYTAIRAETFLSRCVRAEFLSMQSIRPGDGQCGGWQLAFLAHLDGYEVPFET